MAVNTSVVSAVVTPLTPALHVIVGNGGSYTKVKGSDASDGGCTSVGAAGMDTVSEPPTTNPSMVAVNTYVVPEPVTAWDATTMPLDATRPNVDAVTPVTGDENVAVKRESLRSLNAEPDGPTDDDSTTVGGA